MTKIVAKINAWPKMIIIIILVTRGQNVFIVANITNFPWPKTWTHDYFGCRDPNAASIRKVQTAGGALTPASHFVSGGPRQRWPSALDYK